MLRDAKYKKSSAGLNFTLEESDDWMSRALAFLHSKRAETAKEKTSKLRRALNMPRQASLDFLHCLENGLKGVFGVGLEKFEVADLLDAPVVSERVEFPASSGLSGDSIPAMLLVAGDQASDQCCPFAFLQGLKLNFQQFPDRAHMSNNSSLNGAVRAGFQSAVRISISVCNLRYGPRNNGTFMRYLESGAADISQNLTHRDPLVQMMWPEVCRDKRWVDDELTSPAACDRWLATLCTTKCATVKGPQAGTSRWYSYVHALWFWDECWAETLMLGIFTSLCSGWARKWEELFGP